MPRSALAGDASDVFRVLLDGGLFIAPSRKDRERLVEYFTLCNPSVRARCVDRAGWCPENGGPKQLDGVVAVNVDEGLGHLAMALSKKSQAGKTSRNDLHRQKSLKLGPRLHGIYSGQSGIQCCLFKLVVEPWSQCLH
jgi:Domain of unknown function (DUF927)